MHTNWKRVQCCCVNVGDVVLDKRLEAWQLFAIAIIKLAEPNFFNS